MKTELIFDTIDKEIDKRGVHHLTLSEAVELLYLEKVFNESYKQDETQFRSQLKEGKIAHAYKENGRWKIPKSRFREGQLKNSNLGMIIKEKLPYIIIATFLVLFFVYLKVTDYHNPYKKIENSDIEKIDEPVFIGDIIEDTVQNGIVKNLFRSTSKIESEGQLLNGKKEGLWKFYYENGVLESKSFYKNNMKSGITEKYSAEGEITEKGTYINDVLNGKLVKYIGGIKDKIFEYKNGKKNGKYIGYDYRYDKPYIHEVGSYKNDLMDGEWQIYDYFYNPNTNKYGNKLILTNIETYKEDKMEGRNIIFHAEEGFLLIETAYENNLEHGIRKSYCPKGVDKKKLYIVQEFAYGNEVNREPYKCKCEFPLYFKNSE
ncbi:toxin-antitoxin system YwqK family antitoxin [Flavobacterium antarcticum]|uniref:toxin-antitoxin system YwqK family antitoxin n=1 Tax=Flavobacterium antarcticum TaxID=271155 RepID=UPI0003B34775|nr:hypothetical protein [Flavobacterium antarcticum]